MKILITGATGFIGKNLVKRLEQQNHQIIVLSRNADMAKAILGANIQTFVWNSTQTPPPDDCFTNVNAVINLAGESIADSRWTEQKKKLIYDSRILSTRNLISGIKRNLSESPLTFISTSAIGIYGNTKELTIDENSPLGDTFLSKVCIDWEAETHQLKALANLRTVILRLGVVLGSNGGFIEKIKPLIKYYLAAPLGNGQQWMSWIHIEDLINLILFSLESSSINGVLNATAPHPIRNYELMKSLTQKFHRPLLPPVPKFILQTIYGEMANEMLLASQKVLPHTAIEL